MKNGCAALLSGTKMAPQTFVKEYLRMVAASGHIARPDVQAMILNDTVYKNFMVAQVAYLEYSRRLCQLQPVLEDYRYGEKCTCCINRTVCPCCALLRCCGGRGLLYHNRCLVAQFSGDVFLHMPYPGF